MTAEEYLVTPSPGQRPTWGGVAADTPSGSAGPRRGRRLPGSRSRRGRLRGRLDRHCASTDTGNLHEGLREGQRQPSGLPQEPCEGRRRRRLLRRATATARELSSAAVFQSGRTPVLGRFSLAGGNAHAVDAAATARGLGLAFGFPGGDAVAHRHAESFPSSPTTRRRGSTTDYLPPRPPPAPASPTRRPWRHSLRHTRRRRRP